MLGLTHPSQDFVQIDSGRCRLRTECHAFPGHGGCPSWDSSIGVNSPSMTVHSQEEFCSGTLLRTNSETLTSLASRAACCSRYANSGVEDQMNGSGDHCHSPGH